MAFTAIYDDEERGAWSVPKDETAYCNECGDQMHVVSQSVDGRARHFSHNPDRNNEGGGGGGCSGGESADHRKWKNFAAERLNEVFNEQATARASVEQRLAAPYSDSEKRAADACVFFDEWDEQFGRGLAVEVQHKNKDKDIDAVQKDYNRQDVAVVWLTGDDFHSDGLRLGGVDFRHQAREQTSICEMVDRWKRVDNHYTHFERGQTHRDFVLDAHDPRGADRKVPAEIISGWVLPNPREHWQENGWEAAFRSPDGDYKASEYRVQTAVTNRPTTLSVKATIPRHWYWPTPAEYWSEHSWEAAFRQKRSDELLEPFREGLDVSIACTLPPKIVDALIYQRLDMATIPDTSSIHTDRGEETEILVKIPSNLVEQLPQQLSKYTCRQCIWVGDDYILLDDGSSGRTAVCPECESGISLNI